MGWAALGCVPHNADVICSCSCEFGMICMSLGNRRFFILFEYVFSWTSLNSPKTDSHPNLKAKLGSHRWFNMYLDIKLPFESYNNPPPWQLLVSNPNKRFSLLNDLKYFPFCLHSPTIVFINYIHIYLYDLCVYTCTCAHTRGLIQKKCLQFYVGPQHQKRMSVVWQ